MNGFRPALAAFMLVALTGCGGPTLIPVQGRVSLDDKPLTTGKVIFHPDAEKGNKSGQIAVGDIDAQGSYTLSTGTKQGAIAGRYKVAVNAMKPFDPEKPYVPEVWLIPRKYGDPQKSGLSIQIVESAAAGGYDLKLRSETK
jgi:hypothetical protein